MLHHTKKTVSRKQEAQLLGITTILLVLLFGSLYYNLLPKLNETKKDQSIVIDKSFSTTHFVELLQEKSYLNDKNDLNLLASTIKNQINIDGNIENLGVLNKRSFAIPATTIESQGGEDYKRRLRDARIALGFSDDATNFDSTLFERELQTITTDKYEIDVGTGEFSIKGQIFLDSSKAPVSNVLIRLKRHFSKDSSANNKQDLWYVRTNPDGNFAFNKIPKGQSFSVLPLKSNFEFGASKGTEQIKESLSLNFKARPHKVKLFSSDVFQQLRNDKSLLARTPKDFTTNLVFYTLLFFLAFWVVHFVWTICKFEGDNMILPLIMFLTGISILMMYAIQDPLQDTLRGDDTTLGVIGGLVAMTLISQINIARWYTTKWFDLVGFWRKKSTFQLPGLTWLLGAFILTIIVIAFGDGPEGSNVKVNLELPGLSFQPSEITKYFILLFFAAYFTKNTEFLRQIPDIKWRLKNTALIAAGFSILLIIYLFLGDMGPALVLCFTFLMFYSAARGDFQHMIFGGTVYGILLIAISYIEPDNKLPYLAITFVYLFLWWAMCQFYYKDYKESAILIAILVAAFVFGEILPSVGTRLAERNAIFVDKWNNETFGGDQIAHGIWSLTSGGAFGQGLGNGFPRVMPANHTDMILPSIGEELGMFGLIAVFICIGILLHRTILIARRNGQLFPFYLSTGIAIVIGSQFLLMASGSIGTLPLTGVTVPFLSFGKVSMVINIAAMGIVMSISNQVGSATEREYIQNRYDNIMASGTFTFTVGMLKIFFILFFYQVLKVDRYIVEPSVVVNKLGERKVSYNPRISIFTKAIGAGNIYDSKKRILATSNKELLSESSTGISDGELNKTLQKYQKRYYPYGEHLFFWVGDFNNSLLWDDNNGYAAEFRHLNTLRGFKNDRDYENKEEETQETTYSSKKYKESRFLPVKEKIFRLTKYDYSALVPLLKAGINSKKVAELKEQNRDIQLTVDAALQKELQEKIDEFEINGKKYRTSVAIVNASTGDVLATTTNPIPDYKVLRRLLDLPIDEQKKALAYERLDGKMFSDRDLAMTFATAPGSTAKIITGFAALNKLGATGKNQKYTIVPSETFLSGEPGSSVAQTIAMDVAIDKSSNVYFIKIANEKTLDNELQALYEGVGMKLASNGGYHLYNTISEKNKEINRAIWNKKVFQEKRQIYKNHKFDGTQKRLRSEFSYITWGQGQLDATPLALARMTATIANDGQMAHSRFLIAQNGKKLPILPPLALQQKPNVAITMRGLMENEHHGQDISQVKVYGKSGTPERIYKNSKGKEVKLNDNWYTFFAESETGVPIVITIRIERLPDKEFSTNAVNLAEEKIIPTLINHHYLVPNKQ